ncbi:hypothetical protein EVAR_88272_1 [Eumeta japonica]|uniref:Uncharacterized protein n=1 Tax=Eumeta variegata TaxID=151549 RepID=A0A4C1XQ58_EUMVA|nr:hypothetical protein EVAR_88272_1 [Eumeta japonica]
MSHVKEELATGGEWRHRYRRMRCLIDTRRCSTREASGVMLTKNFGVRPSAVPERVPSAIRERLNIKLANGNNEGRR